MRAGNGARARHYSVMFDFSYTDANLPNLEDIPIQAVPLGNEPGQIIAALPSLLGYVPQDCLVILTLIASPGQPGRFTLGPLVRSGLAEETVVAASHAIVQALAHNYARGASGTAVCAAHPNLPDPSAFDGAAPARDPAEPLALSRAEHPEQLCTCGFSAYVEEALALVIAIHPDRMIVEKLVRCAVDELGLDGIAVGGCVWVEKIAEGKQWRTLGGFHSWGSQCPVVDGCDVTGVACRPGRCADGDGEGSLPYGCWDDERGVVGSISQHPLRILAAVKGERQFASREELQTWLDPLPHRQPLYPRRVQAMHSCPDSAIAVLKALRTICRSLRKVSQGEVVVETVMKSTGVVKALALVAREEYARFLLVALGLGERAPIMREFLAYACRRTVGSTRRCLVSVIAVVLAGHGEGVPSVCTALRGIEELKTVSQLSERDSWTADLCLALYKAHLSGEAMKLCHELAMAALVYLSGDLCPDAQGVELERRQGELLELQLEVHGRVVALVDWKAFSFLGHGEPDERGSGYRAGK